MPNTHFGLLQHLSYSSNTVASCDQPGRSNYSSVMYFKYRWIGLQWYHLYMTSTQRSSYKSSVRDMADLASTGCWGDEG